MNNTPNIMHFRDRGHYYLNGILVDDLTMATCREQGGIPSVTTKIGSYMDPGLMFWKIGENIEAAFNSIDAAIACDADLEQFRVLVADEYYRMHNEMRLGTKIHYIMDKALTEGILLQNFQQFFAGHADSEIKDLVFSCKAAFAWALDTISQGRFEHTIYSKEHGISGTCDGTGMVATPKGDHLIGGIDWKCKRIKIHPGFKADGQMKAMKGPKKEDAHRMQLGAYGRVEGWEHAYICVISTNPDVQGIKPIWYDKAELVKGYRAYANIAAAYEILNGYRA